MTVTETEQVITSSQVMPESLGCLKKLTLESPFSVLKTKSGLAARILLMMVA